MYSSRFSFRSCYWFSLFAWTQARFLSISSQSHCFPYILRGTEEEKSILSVVMSMLRWNPSLELSHVAMSYVLLAFSFRSWLLVWLRFCPNSNSTSLNSTTITLFSLHSYSDRGEDTTSSRKRPRTDSNSAARPTRSCRRTDYNSAARPTRSCRRTDSNSMMKWSYSNLIRGRKWHPG